MKEAKRKPRYEPSYEEETQQRLHAGEYTCNWTLSAHVLNTILPHYYKHCGKWTISTSSNHIFSLILILFFNYLRLSNNQPILGEFGAQKERVEKKQ